MQDNTTFINYINDHYDELYYKYRQFCKEKNYAWDEDIFQDTILKCYEAIERKGKLEDTSNQGIENYFFISFKMNLKREGQYARNQKRDLNYSSEKISSAYEDFYNKTKTPAIDKIKNDLFVDFSTLYIMMKIEDNFDNEHFYLFKLKTLCGYTYKQLADKTRIKGVRQKVLDVKNWLRDNVKKEEVKDAFYELYGMYM